MSSLPRCGYSSIESQRQLLNSYKNRNVNLKHRHYSSSKFIKTMMLNDSKTIKTIEREGGSQMLQGAVQKKELRRYCVNKFRMGGDKQKIVLKRKNSSLKLFRKDQSVKIQHIQKIDDIKNQESLISKKDQRVNSLSRETLSSQQTIPIKRRVQILKLNRNNRPKLVIKDQNLAKHANKADVSFEEKLKERHFDEEKVSSTQKIRSQNLLGIGLKKSSSSKIKILVKDPFERQMRHQKALQTQCNTASIESIPELKESQIIQMDESNPSLTNQHDLEQLLAMM